MDKEIIDIIRNREITSEQAEQLIREHVRVKQEARLIELRQKMSEITPIIEIETGEQE